LEETLAEVKDFVELLLQKKGKTVGTLLDIVRELAHASMTLDQVYEEVSTITGALPDTVTQPRQERG
jgi:hypothetical protein